MIKSFDENLDGNDYIVGDIHGAFAKLKSALVEIGFDPYVDRLFSVGDLVDRGAESEKFTEWLDEPWFHAVRGNHEQMAIDAFRSGDYDHHFANGGAWFYAQSQDERTEQTDYFQQMPLAITVKAADGHYYGIVHAECAGNDWGFFLDCLESECERTIQTAIWSRSRISSEDKSIVNGIKKIFVGHTPIDSPVQLGNTIYLDTMGWRGKKFTIYRLNDHKLLRV